MAKQSSIAGDLHPREEGLLLRGVLAGRRRKEFKKDGQPVRYLITLSVLAGHTMHRVDMWSDEKAPQSMPTTGAVVSLPVEVRTFTTARGTQSRLVIAGDGDGENF